MDEGEVGVFEYPNGGDVPVLGTTGEPLSYAFTVDVPVIYEPEVVVVDQTAPSNGVQRVVTVPRVVTPDAAWIAIHDERNLLPANVIGWASVEAGENEDVQVELDRELIPDEPLYAMLHTDRGQVGTFEFPGPDEPVVDADGDPIAPTFLVDIPAVMSPTPYTVESLDTLQLERVVAAEAGWIVVREEDGAAVGDTLGTVAVPSGESFDVVVPITARPLIDEERVQAQLFAEDATVGSYNGTELPVTDLQGATVNASILLSVDTRVGPSLYVEDQALGETNTIVLDQIVWDGTNATTHIVIYDSDPTAGAATAIGVTSYLGPFVVTDRSITLDVSPAPGDTIWVVLRDDTIPGSLFDGNDDLILVDATGAPYMTTFEILASP